MARLFAAILVGLASISLLAPLDAGDKQEAKKSAPQVHQVPFRLTPIYHLIVRAKVNNKGPFNFIFDTGFNANLMTPSAAKQAGLGTAGTQRIERLELEGGAVVEKCLCNVNIPPQVSLVNRTKGEGCEVHGILGYDFMRHFRIRLDYATHKMTWTRDKADDKDDKDAEAIVIPFARSLTNPKHLMVETHVNGKGPYRFLFDTGAPGTVVGPQVGLRGPEVVLDTVQIGALKVEKSPAFVQKVPAFESMAGIIGFPLIARYVTTFDFPGQRLVLRPGTYTPPQVPKSIVDGKPGPGTPEPTGGQWGLKVEKDAGDVKPGIPVTALTPDGAAAQAGIKAGDRLLLVDDSWIESESDFRWASNRARPGIEVLVIVERDGKLLTLKAIPKAPA